MGERSPNADQAAIIKLARQRGYYNHQIAAYWGFNQGRISEVNTGKAWPHVEPANDLPPDFPAQVA